MPTALTDDLSRTRTLFEHWRATRSGLREKIPEELRQAVVALRDRYPVSQLCRELHVSAGALRARLRQVKAQPVAPAEFVPLSWEALGLPVADRSVTPADAPIRLLWERADGTRLQLLLPASLWARAESLWQAFLPS
jgi:transposase-like protein